MNGARIGITAARRADEQARLVRSLGGVPVVGSTIGLDRPAPDADVEHEIRLLVDRLPRTVVVMTGIGGRHLLDVAGRAGLAADLRDALDRATVIARGAKARNVLRRLDVRVDTLADPPSTAGLVALLPALDLDAGPVAVVCTGPHDEPIVDVLRERGADVLTAHPYAIDLPEEAEPARRLAGLVFEGGLEAVTFTSANAVDGLASLVAMSGDEGRRPDPRVIVAAVGPVTRRALESLGWDVHVEPRTPRMGAMYQALAAHQRSSASGHSTTPGSISTD